ncbi:MAG TPA: MarC family protein [Methanoregulaceae archaeon]|nr:MarC family protein [Methanoregulaceae archaeon]
MATDLVSFVLFSLSSLLVIVNPLGAAMIYVSMTADFDRETKRRTAIEASWYALVVLVVFALLGGIILELFGISLAAFRIGGGILLFMIGLEMVYAKVSRSKMTATEKYEGDADDVAVMPIAIPMIAGPGAITTVIVLMDEARGIGIWAYGVVLLSIMVTSLATHLMMSHSDWIVSRIGQREFRAVNRIMGILLIAIAVEFVIGGLRTAFPILAGGA